MISALRRADRNPAVAAWSKIQEPLQVFLSVITVTELQRGVDRLEGTDPRQAQILARWLETVLEAFGDRILPLTVKSARRWATLSVKIGNRSLDLAIAATALEHGLIVATRNVAHFKPTGVATIDPFAA